MDTRAELIRFGQTFRQVREREGVSMPTSPSGLASTRSRSTPLRQDSLIRRLT